MTRAWTFAKRDERDRTARMFWNYEERRVASRNGADRADSARAYARCDLRARNRSLARARAGVFTGFKQTRRSNRFGLVLEHASHRACRSAVSSRTWKRSAVYDRSLDDKVVRRRRSGDLAAANPALAICVSQTVDRSNTGLFVRLKR